MDEENRENDTFVVFSNQMRFFCSYYIIFDKLFRRIQIPGVRKFGSAEPNILCAEKIMMHKKIIWKSLGVYWLISGKFSKTFGARSPQKYFRILELRVLKYV